MSVDVLKLTMQSGNYTRYLPDTSVSSNDECWLTDNTSYFRPNTVFVHVGD